MDWDQNEELVEQILRTGMYAKLYFNGMFEVVRHNMDRAAAHRYVKMLNRYHMAGFGTVFDPQP